MNQSRITKHNATVVLRQARGKTKEERTLLYERLRLGPLGAVLITVSGLSQTGDGRTTAAPSR